MSSLMQGRAYRLGETVQYGSIYGYRKNRVALLDAATGDNIGWIKEEVVPGLPGQPDVTCYYEKNGWRPSGKLRFYQSLEAMVLALGGTIDASRLTPPEPAAELELQHEVKDKAVIKRAAPKPAKKARKPAARVKARKPVVKSTARKALKPTRKPAKKAAKKTSARKRKVKSTL